MTNHSMTNQQLSKLAHMMGHRTSGSAARFINNNKPTDHKRYRNAFIIKEYRNGTPIEVIAKRWQLKLGEDKFPSLVSAIGMTYIMAKDMKKEEDHDN